MVRLSHNAMWIVGFVMMPAPFFLGLMSRQNAFNIPMKLMSQEKREQVRRTMEQEQRELQAGSKRPPSLNH